jgi:hypothetical protein
LAAVAEILSRLERTPAAAAHALAGRDGEALARRPEPQSWSSIEILCHLRDVEELFQLRFHTILALDEPVILAFSATPEDLRAWRIAGAIGHPFDPDRWAVERQYGRCDPHEALAAWRPRREEVVTLLSGLSGKEWERGGIHPSRGRRPLLEWVESLAAHDDNHLAQLRRAVDGRA